MPLTPVPLTPVPLMKGAFALAALSGVAAAATAFAGLTDVALGILALALTMLVAATALLGRTALQELEILRRREGRVLRATQGLNDSLETVVHRMAALELVGSEQVLAHTEALRATTSAVERMRSETAARDRELSTALHETVRNAPLLNRIARRVEGSNNRLERMRTMVEMLPSEIVNLSRLQDALITGHRPMAALGGWAATTTTMQFLVETVIDARNPPTVVECGSGASTVWLAAAVRQRGAGRVIALEHEALFARRTREELRRQGLSDYATVVDAPLVPTGRSGALWYDLGGAGDLDPIDLLFVDGPPGDTGQRARQPAFGQLAGSLRPGALIVLDDTVREDEKEILSAWLSKTVSGRRLRVVDTVGRSTVLRVELER